jgi:hypothetical protein
VSELVVDHAVPFLERHVRTGDLTAIWKAGISPGLTREQRIHYLEQLAE